MSPNLAVSDSSAYANSICWNNINTSDTELLTQLTAILEAYPDVVLAKGPYGSLPMHLALCRISIVKILFDAYPEAIYVTNNFGLTPLDYARITKQSDVVSFFETQLEFVRQACVVVTPDENGQLPIHRMLQNSNASSGALKLVVAANPESACAPDNQGYIPLHLACKAGNLSAFKYLAELNEASLKTGNAKGDLALHIACREGKCDIANYILEKSDYAVSIKCSNGKWPLELLLDAACDRNSSEYVQAVGRLIQADPIFALVDCLGCNISSLREMG